MVLLRDDGGATAPFPFLKAPSLDRGVDVVLGCVGGCCGGIALRQLRAVSICVAFPSCSARLLRGCAIAKVVSCGAQCDLLQPLPWYTWWPFVYSGSWGTTSPAGGAASFRSGTRRLWPSTATKTDAIVPRLFIMLEWTWAFPFHIGVLHKFGVCLVLAALVDEDPD